VGSEENDVKQTYRVVAGLIALGVVVQASAIALGGFTVLHDVDNGLVVDKNFDPNLGQMIHGINGMYLMPLLGLILLIVSFLAAKQVPGARKWGGIVFGLIVLQVALAFVSFAAPVVGALHGINALAVLGTAIRATMLTRDARPARATGGPVDVPAQSTGSNSPQSARTV
jgi:heme A synthase